MEKSKICKINKELIPFVKVKGVGVPKKGETSGAMLNETDFYLHRQIQLSVCCACSMERMSELPSLCYPNFGWYENCNFYSVIYIYLLNFRLINEIGITHFWPGLK